MVTGRPKKRVPWNELVTVGVCVAWLDGVRWLFLEERYRTFLLPPFHYLLGAAAAVLLLYVVLFVFGKRREGPERFPLSRALHGLVLVTPLLFIYAAQGTGLGTHALAMKRVESGFLGPGRPSAEKPPPDAGGEWTILDLVQSVDDLEGREVAVRGAVFADDRYPEGMRVLFRFAMLCCAADAVPLGILVALPETPPSLENDDWVRVEGVLRRRLVNGTSHPVVEASRIEVLPSPPPGDRYISLF
jgi:uncharacterized repeat protein (TIGR03943 family)